MYFVAITAPQTQESTTRFRVIFVHPLKKSVSFFISYDPAMHRWIPSDKQLIDPWVADNVGYIIEEKIWNKPLNGPR